VRQEIAKSNSASVNQFSVFYLLFLSLVVFHLTMLLGCIDVIQNYFISK